MLNGATHLFITKPDVLSGLETLKVCTAYRVNGETTQAFPTQLETLQRAEPIYEELPGWREDISGCAHWDELPPAAQAYFDRIAELTGAPAALISVGPGRDQTITRSDPFA
jgi:adenylosuccinate synthase